MAIKKEFLKVKVSQLIPYENNPRINEPAVADTMESIRQCENLDPIEVDENMVILSGHTRMLAMQRLGIAETEVVKYSGLTENQKKKYRILANKTQELAQWDFDKLKKELDGLDFDGFDIVEFYHKYSNGSGYLRLNRKIKEQYIHKMRDLCHELGLRFYVSDAHFKECCDSCCCCALPDDWEYSRGHFAAALQIAKKTGKVQWKDIEKDMYFLNFDYRKSEGFNTNSAENRAHFAGMTMKDYMRYLWNAPKRGQSPYRLFEKVLIPNGYDEEGNIVYYYNQSVTFQKQGEEKEFDLMRL